MISLFAAFGVLIIGYFVYGKVAEKIFAPDDRQTPAVAINDAVDCVPMKTWKAFLIQLLNIAETFNLNQKKIKNRLLITIPLLVIGGLLTWFAISNDSGFQIVWRYFSWSNQTLAMIALWVATAYLLKKGKYRFGSLLTALPASFMTAVSLTYNILMAKEGFRLNQTISYIVGISAAVILFAVYLIALYLNTLIRRNMR